MMDLGLAGELRPAVSCFFCLGVGVFIDMNGIISGWKRGRDIWNGVGIVSITSAYLDEDS